MIHALISLYPLAIVTLYGALPARITNVDPPIDVHCPALGWANAIHALVEVAYQGDQPTVLHTIDTETLALDGHVLTITQTWAEPDLEVLRAWTHAQIEAKRDEVMWGGFTHDFGGLIGIHQLDTDKDSQDRWNQLLTASIAMVSADLGETPSLWRDKQNNEFTITTAENIPAILAMFSAGHEALAVSWSLKNALAAATTNAEMNAIDIEGAAWPAN